MTTDAELRKRAIARLHQRTAFWRALGMFVIGNILMVVIWAVSGRGYFWPVWTIVGGLFALAPMAWHTFGPQSTGPTDAQIEAEMDRLRGGNG